MRQRGRRERRKEEKRDKKREATTYVLVRLMQCLHQARLSKSGS